LENIVTIDIAVDFHALVRLASDIARWPGLTNLLPATPGKRTWTSLETPVGWDAWLIAWPEGTDTGWHDHQGSAGVFAVAQGKLTEFSVAASKVAAPTNINAEPGHIVAKGDDIRTRRILSGEARSFGPQHIHQVVNESARTAYSVHVYAPTLRGMSRYEWSDDALVLTGLEAAGTWQG
jgi:hypothetical protein